MRILEADLKEAMQDIPDVVLKQIESMIKGEIERCGWDYKDALREFTGRMGQDVDENILANVINGFVSRGKVSGLKTNEFVKDKYQPERVISKDAIEHLANKVMMMRRTEKLRNDYRGKSLQEIKEARHSYSDFGIMENYGLGLTEFLYGLDYLEAEMGIQECVGKLSEEELVSLKSTLEVRGNSPERFGSAYTRHVKDIVKEIFGDEVAEASWVEYLTVSDIAEAFEARETELQNPKPEKMNLWDKLKNAAQSVKSRVEEIFSRFGRKALPEPVADKQMPKIPILRESIVPEGGKAQYQQHAKEVAEKFNAQEEHVADVKETDKDLGEK